MNYSGFCFAKTRYLTDDEKILLAFNSTNRLTERRITVDGGKTHSVVKTIPYGSFEEFRKENSNCCTILVDKVRGFPSSNFFDRIIGNGYNVDEVISIKYKARDVDEKGNHSYREGLNSVRVVTNCGKVKDSLLNVY
jgi:hypothetical protein